MAATGGFTGFTTAVAQELPNAVAVMDPFHVICLADDALDTSGRRARQETCGRRGCKGDLLYAARRTLHTGTALLTGDAHVEVEAT